MINIPFGGANNVDHKLPLFWSKTLLSAEWEGYVDHKFKPYI